MYTRPKPHVSSRWNPYNIQRSDVQGQDISGDYMITKANPCPVCNEETPRLHAKCGYKKCIAGVRGCDTWKKLSEFQPSKHTVSNIEKNEGGLHCMCIECHTKYMKDYNKKAYARKKAKALGALSL